MPLERLKRILSSLEVVCMERVVYTIWFNNTGRNRSSSGNFELGFERCRGICQVKKVVAGEERQSGSWEDSSRGKMTHGAEKMCSVFWKRQVTQDPIP